MATVTKSIQQGGGGDYTTLASWESATNLNSNADIWKGEIDDANDYDESISLAGNHGTGTSSHVWLTTGSTQRHDGLANNGNGRIAFNGTAAFAIRQQEDWAMVSHLEIHRPAGSAGANDNGIRFATAGSNDMLVSHCIIWTLDAAGMNGLQVNSGSITNLRIDHTVIYGFQRHGINLDVAVTADVDHCFVTATADSSTEGNLYSDSAATFNVYNTVIASTDGASGNEVYMSNASSVLNGSHNVRTGSAEISVSGTDNATNWQDASDGTTDSAPGTAGVYVTDYTGLSTFNLLPIDHANNVASENGTNRQGSEPDARQDFSVDIAGNARPTTGVDIGPWQFTVSLQDLTPSKLTVTPSFHNPTVTATVDVAPSKLTVTPSFHNPTVTPGTVTLTVPTLRIRPSFTRMDDGTGFYWPLNDASGAPQDAWSNGYHGTVGGTLGYGETGPYAGQDAIKMDSNGDSVQYSGYNPDLTASWTAGAWFKVNSFTGDSTNDNGDTHLVTKESWTTSGMRLWLGSATGTGHLRLVRIYDSGPRAGVEGDIGATDTGYGTWHHAVATYDGTTLELWVDGVSAGTSVQAITQNTTNFLTGGGWRGTADDATWDVDRAGVFFSERKYTDAEIAQDFAGGPGIFAPSATVGAVDLQPSLLSVAPTFYAPTVTVGAVDLQPELLTVVPSFFGPTVAPGTVDLQPSKLTVTPSFHNPTVTTTVDVAPSLLTVTPSFFGPVVTASGGIAVDALLTATPTFHAPTVTTGAVDTQPSLISVTPSFPTPAVSLEVDPSFLQVTPSFYGPTVTPGAVSLSPSLISVTPSFPTLAITAPQTVEPAVLTATPTFYGPTVTTGSVDTAPSLITITPSFYGPTVTSSVDVAPDLITITPTFYAPTATPGAVTITVPLLTVTPTFYDARVSRDFSVSGYGSPEASWQNNWGEANWSGDIEQDVWNSPRPQTSWVAKQPSL